MESTAKAKLYEAASKFIELLASPYGSKIRETEPEIVTLAEKVVTQYQSEYAGYVLETNERAIEVMNELDELTFAKEVIGESSHDSMKQLTIEIEKKAKEIEQILSLRADSLLDKYFLNITSTQVKERANVEDNKNFQNWFAGSKVVDKDGKPLIVYHGSSGFRDEFNMFAFKLFPATYFALNREYAEWFSKVKGGKGMIFEVYLRVQKPIDISDFKTTLMTYDEFVTYIFFKHGYQLPEAPMLKAQSERHGGMEAWKYLRWGTDWINFLKRTGDFDGIHYYENNPQDKVNGKDRITEAWMVFNKNQIKVADIRNTTYSLYSDVATMSEGGLL